MNSPSPARAVQMFDETKDCVICGCKASQPDTRCQSARYCSKQCQEADWSSHKLLCRKYAQMGPRPTPSHRRAIYFPQDKTQPLLRWILCEKVKDDCGVPFEYPHASLYLGSDDPVPDSRYIQRSYRHGGELSHTVEVIYRDTFLSDGSTQNRSITTTIGASGPMWYPFLGPAVIVRKLGAPSDPGFYGDISLTDYRHALDYFAAYLDFNDTTRPDETPTRTRTERHDSLF